MRGIFVTGTDTGVGKSILAAAICAGLVARGERVAAFKPVVTGLDEPAGDWPPDHELLAATANANQTPEEVAPYRFGPPASPHLAADLAGTRIEPELLLDRARRAAEHADVLVIEGVGGLMVPLTASYLVCDFARAVGLPAVIAARPGLGTINHSLLSVEAARRAGIDTRGVVLTPWPTAPSTLEASNREAIVQLAATEVVGLPAAQPASLLEASRALPLGDLVSPPV